MFLTEQEKQELLKVSRQTLIKYLSEFIEHPSHGGDLSTQVLKGHLLVEKTITELFITQLPHSKSLYGKGGASLNCHQIICLAEAMTTRSQEIPWIWIASKRLNKIRIGITYQLRDNWLEENVGDLIALVKNENPELAEKQAK